MERCAVDEEQGRSEHGEDQQRAGAGSARASRRIRCQLRLPLRHRRRVYQSVAGILAALGLSACGDPAPRFGDTASDGLVLVRSVGASKEIVRVRLADSAAQAVTATPDVEETWPFWSELARRLVYLTSTDGVWHDLVIWDPDRRVTTTIAGSPLRDEAWPAWSPRRPELVFAFRGGAPPSGLVIADVPSRTQRLIAAPGKQNFFLRPGFAPDGASVIAQRYGANARGSSLWRIEPGSAPKPLTQDPAWHDMKPAYTRDGREILFSRRPAAGGTFDILAIPATGGAPRTLAINSEGNDDTPRPSPLRDELVFVSDRSGRSALYLAPLAGGVARLLAADPTRQYFAPHWSPDGERVAAIATPDHAGRPRLSEPEGLAETNVVVFDREGRRLFDAPGFMPDWMPPWREP